MRDEQLDTSLRAGTQALGLALTDGQHQALLQYLALLSKWNKVYNLTAVRDPAEMLRLHLLDCLAVVAPLQREAARLATPEQGAQLQLLDVGAGGGLPGVVLAVCCPGISVSCVDAVAKKMAFVRQVAAELRLPNLQAIHARVETLTQSWDIISSRAFASLNDFVSLTLPVLRPGGLWMAMKGREPDAEITELPSGVQVFHVEQLQVPGLDAQRCIVWMGKPAIIGR
ncbi:16S rRNA (guanine(527)-N(7))-methyltransferase RsmG [Corticibacter populi]|uniref:Ribosomal RNA small subunit methyltransferase G n=1 Tax=Corticibacter populi TaxID=1550736 RepID=A0A3M6QP04_9BURK|nr:16S rRNA (guanine(527)-N(7))-methyltransferase RsmG [Corticibacter populi]RMX04788.1 16S rRNA (guanine(527)-N(7))-methyltransferase RsmG [Corticibacter populi]RZS33800.1 16S rRNA m(7)G-527 methyltransferase [Corticibacter populi]